MKDENLHFNHFVSIWFKIDCSGVQGQNYENRVKQI